MSNGSIFPYLPQTSTSQGQATSNDLVISKAFPAVIFEPTEPNSVYQETVEVNGALCLVTNANWNANNLRWQQDSPCNNATPAYLLALGSDGSMIRYAAAATNVLGTAVTFNALFNIDANGNISRTPSSQTSSSQIGESTALTWAPGTSVVMNADELFITDSASSASSSVKKITVNGTVVWNIQKDGTLTVGKIPYANVTGAPAPFNPSNPTFTGTATFSGPIDANGGVVATDVNTATLEASGTSTLHGVTATDVSTQTLEVAGNSSLHATNFNGAVTTTSGTPVVGLSSTGTVTVTNPTNNAWVVEVTDPFPVNITNSWVCPSVGSSVSITTKTTRAFVIGQYVDCYNYSGVNPEFLGVLTANTTSGGLVTWTVLCKKIISGSAGQTCPAGQGFMNIGSYDPSITTQGQTFATATNFAAGSTTGTLTLPSPLPGTSANSYLVIVSGSLQFLNGSKQLTLTGSGAGVTWPSSPQPYQNANAGTFPFTFYGTAQGGSLPSVTWTCNDSLYNEPMTMVMVAYFQS